MTVEENNAQSERKKALIRAAREQAKKGIEKGVTKAVDEIFSKGTSDIDLHDNIPDKPKKPVAKKAKGK